MARCVTTGTIGHSCQRSGGKRVSGMVVGFGTSVGAWIVSGGGAIGMVSVRLTPGTVAV